MGTLDNTQGSEVKRKIQFLDITSYTPSQIESAYNDNYGAKGWRIIQIIVFNTSRYMVAEKEL